MLKPTIEVLGVYSIPVTAELLREQTDLLYGRDLPHEKRQAGEESCREQLEGVVLLEVLVRDRDDRFKVGDFTQANDAVSRDSWQAAYAERYLTLDSDEVLSELWSRAPNVDTFRLAFFFHYWDTTKPLLTSYGELICPAVRPMPDRLQRLTPYPPMD